MYAQSNDKLVEAMGTSSYTTSNGAITITNTNRLLHEYDAIIGGKTGYDLDSGYCLVNIAGKDDAQMIAVTLDGVAPGDWYDDNRVLLEYGFEQHATLAGAGAGFDGEIAGFSDPSTAEIGRAAEPGGSLVANNNRSVVADRPGGDPASQIVETVEDRSAVDPLERRFSDRATTWSMVFVAIALVGIRGLISIRSQRDHSTS
jgi:D-alanyl-D-alanine carboxypeptidase